MTKKEILDAIHGKMIISCQAVEDEPLYVEEKSIMYLMARAAKQAGTPAIRTSSIRDVIAIKEETGLPVIGLVKLSAATEVPAAWNSARSPTTAGEPTRYENDTVWATAALLRHCSPT